jgi:tetratricopeptide (TPR) repeat protein
LNLNEMGRLREALPAYLKAVTLNPSYGAGLVDFAHGLSTAGRYDESLEYALRARRLIPTPGPEATTWVLRSCYLATTRDRSAF